MLVELAMHVRSLIERVRHLPLRISLLSVCLAASSAFASDAEKIVGPNACAECHKEEAEAWKGTHHFKTYREMPRSAKADEIAAKLGVRRIRQETLCIGCHFTLQEKDNKAQPIDLLRIARNTTDALGAYEQSLKCEPAQPAVLAKMGDILLQSGRLDDALALAKRARSAAPGNAEAERLERNVLAAAGHLNEACAVIEAQVGDPREKARRYDELAAFLRSRKRFAEAVSIDRPEMAEEERMFFLRVTTLRRTIDTNRLTVYYFRTTSAAT